MSMFSIIKFLNKLIIPVYIKSLDLYTKILSPKEALKLLFEIDNKIYRLLGKNSIRYGNGIHTKHRHINYHQFFIDNIENESKILDIGCGYGFLAYDIAKNTNCKKIVGIDISKPDIQRAKKEFCHPRINFICEDALSYFPDLFFDTIILSNVLEHIENREDFLLKIKKKYNSPKILIRVPIYERDWRVPLKEELGINYRLDSTHFIEYRIDEFFNEIRSSGLYVENYKVNWGEIWAIIKSKPKN